MGVAARGNTNKTTTTSYHREFSVCNIPMCGNTASTRPCLFANDSPWPLAAAVAAAVLPPMRTLRW